MTEQVKQILFLVVVLITNIIQGITGFAGTVLAMPPSVLLVGFDTAKPILNAIGILAGVYVVVTSYKHIDKKEFLKCTGVMVFGIVGGIFLRKYLNDFNPTILYRILGAIVVAVGLVGVYKSFFKKNETDKPQNPVLSYSLLISSGIVHGMFVCGGPLLVSYLTGKLRDKQSFRATISAVWVVLNSIIMVDDVRAGLFNPTIHPHILVLLAISSVILFVGMFIGSVLYKKMSRELFMKITFILLVISGASLFIK